MSNVNKVKRAPVYITIGGEQKQLKYTLNSFAEMEERYGTIDDAMKAMEKGSIKAVRFMLWAGLCHDDDSLTEREVGSKLEVQDLEELAAKMNEVMTSDLPDKEDSKKSPNA